MKRWKKVRGAGVQKPDYFFTLLGEVARAKMARKQRLINIALKVG